MTRTAFEKRMDKRAEVNRAEAAGEVADSKEVRAALMERVRKGEIRLAAAQTELARIKRNAKASGKVTRAQAFQRG